MADVRKFTHDPILIAETAVRPSSGLQRGILNLFAGLRSQGYLGLAWFDEHTPGGLYKGGDWRLEDSKIARTTFRDALDGVTDHQCPASPGRAGRYMPRSLQAHDAIPDDASGVRGANPSCREISENPASRGNGQ